MKKLLLLLFIPLLLMGQIDWRIRQWVMNYLKSGDSTIDTVQCHYADSMTILKIVSDWATLDTIIVPEYADIDSGDIDNLVCNNSCSFGCDIDMNLNDIYEVDSIDTQHMVADVHVQTDSVNANHFVIGDTSNYGSGTIIKDGGFDLFNDTIRIFRGSLVPIPHWVNQSAKIYNDGYNDDLVIDATYLGAGSIIIRSDEGTYTPDTFDIRIFGTGFYPEVDTGGGKGLCGIGIWSQRWREAWIRHHYSTSPDQGDTAQIHMEADSLEIDTENPVAINNDVNVTGDLTSTNSYADSVDYAHSTTDEGIFNDTLRVPNYNGSITATATSGSVFADSANDSLIVFMGGTRGVVYPQSFDGSMSGNLDMNQYDIVEIDTAMWIDAGGADSTWEYQSGSRHCKYTDNAFNWGAASGSSYDMELSNTALTLNQVSVYQYGDTKFLATHGTVQIDYDEDNARPSIEFGGTDSVVWDSLREEFEITAPLSVNGGINYAADAQADDDYEVAIPGITALTAGLTVTFLANTANTDGATLEITSVGDLDAILKLHDQVLATGDIEAGQIVVVVFDGSDWQMTSQLAQ